MSKDLERAYYGQATILDPRCEVLWWRPSKFEELEQGKEDKSKSFAGMRIGDPDIPGDKAVEMYSVVRTLKTINSKILDPKHWFSYGREIVWMSYAESKFLLAEAALRDWKGADKSPETYFQEGIKASFNYYEIDPSIAEAYIRSLNIYQSGKNTFAGTDKEAILEQIITQKWIVIFPNGNEGWAEFRRTDYPALLNIMENNSDGDVPDGKFIKRVMYPYSEGKNPNRPVGVTQGTRVWWDVADTNSDTGEHRKPSNFRSFAQ